jgi:hypothetical protein
VRSLQQGSGALVIAALLSACSRDATPTFNPVPTAPALAVPSVASAPAAVSSPTSGPGSSRVDITGEVVFRTTQDFQCSYALDDFFIRGIMGVYDGVPMYLDINVEFYKGPGAYLRRTQVRLRRVANGSAFYASWYQGHASGTVLAQGKGMDLTAIEVPPEPGTDSHRPVRIGGHFGCLPSARSRG